MKKETIFGIIGGAIMVAGAVVTYSRREELNETAQALKAEVRRYVRRRPRLWTLLFELT